MLVCSRRVLWIGVGKFIVSVCEGIKVGRDMEFNEEVWSDRVLRGMKNMVEEYYMDVKEVGVLGYGGDVKGGRE